MMTKPLAIVLYLCSFLFALAEKEYILEKDDIVRMVVFQEDKLTTEAQIGKSGYVSFPLIGNVKIVGRSLKQAEEEIKTLYEKDFLRSAQVNLSILKYAEKWVMVGGDVRRPGMIKYPEEGALDLRGAVAQAGGVLETADTTRIRVRSKSGKISSYSLKSSGGKVLKHGDSITVGRSTIKQSSVTVSGLVNKPGIVPYPKSGRLDILTAIAQAGDFGRIANKNEVVVSRGGQQIVVNLKDIRRGKVKMFTLRPGDIVIVRESRF